MAQHHHEVPARWERKTEELAPVMESGAAFEDGGRRPQTEKLRLLETRKGKETDSPLDPPERMGRF